MGHKLFDQKSTSRSKSNSKENVVSKTPEERLENSLRMAEERQSKLTEQISNKEKLLKSGDIGKRTDAEREVNHLRAMLAQTATLIKETKHDLEKLKNSVAKDTPMSKAGPGRR